MAVQWHPAVPGRLTDPFLTDVLTGLRRPRKELPCKYFYDAAGSALFDQICALPEYYPTRTELGILHAHAGEMGLRLGAGCQVVEYGSGSGTKTRLLLAALPREQVRALFPDASAFTRRGVATQTHAGLRAELVRTRARGYGVEDARSPPGSRRWRLNSRNRPAADIAHLK